MMTSVSYALGLNTPTVWTVVGVGPWMDKRARVHRGPFTHPQVRFPTSAQLRIRGGEAQATRISEISIFSLRFRLGSLANG